MPEVSSRIVTTPMLDGGPPYYRVSWILWNSAFRAAGLRVGDRVMAVNGAPVVRPKMVSQAIGQYAEYQSWTSETTAALTIRRRAPESGWVTLQVEGELRPSQSEPPGAPGWNEYDGFDSSWRSWYEDAFTRKISSMLDGAWQQAGFNNRYELSEVLKFQERVDFLTTHYPGAFADAVREDFAAACALLQGPLFTLTEADLKWRRAAEERLESARKLGADAWAAFGTGVQSIPPFPAIHPIRDNRDAVVGKYVMLPPIHPVDWLSDGGKTFFAFGSESDGWYFADAETPSSQAMLLALERFRRLVTPSIAEEYVICARILPTVDLRVVAGRAYYGMQVEIAAALVGGAMFVDTSTGKFAGEDIFDQPMHALPADNASPREVLEAFFGALKTGDLKLWKALFADWWVGYLEDGRPLIYPHEIRIDENRWEDSRRAMLSKIYDLRVEWVDEPAVITTGKEFPGAPKIEQVIAEIQHVGLFDGEYRIFNNAGLNRVWELQRIDGGPWRIHSIQNI